MKKKLLALILSVAVVASIAAAGTLAYLTANTDTVTNTFTVGDITMDLKEHELKDDGTLDLESEVRTNEYTHLLPGDTFDKDPFVRIDQGSEKCYVYVTVINELNDAIPGCATLDIDYTQWIPVAQEIGEADITIYRYIGEKSLNGVVDASTAEQILPVFGHVSIDGEKVTTDNIADLNGANIILAGYAHQSENVNDITVADDAATDYFVTALTAGSEF